MNLAGEPYGADLALAVLGTGKMVEFDHFGMPDLTTNGTIRLKVGAYVKDVVLDAQTGVAEVVE